MEEQEKQAQEEVVEEVVEQEAVQQEVAEETVEEKETERILNLKAEAARKQAEIERLRYELEQRNQPKQEPSPDELIKRMSDRELIAMLNSQEYVANHSVIRDTLDERKFDRYNAKKEENRIKLDSELERRKKFPDTFNPAHPLAIKMYELMHMHRLDRTPAGFLVAAELAASQLKQQKATATGRKLEQIRQTDVKANFSGEASRPKPKVSDNAKDEELKQRALAGDEAARIEYFNRRFGNQKQ